MRLRTLPRLRPALPFLVLAALGLLACAPQLDDMRMGVARPPRAPDCSLDVVSPMEMATLQKYEQVGVIRLSNEEAGTDAMSPQARALVRPRACALGGDASP
jgi:hypothetical protein